MDNRHQLDLRQIQLSDENKIGEGLSGKIYKITWNAQLYALKRVYPEKQKAFLHEVGFFKKYQHPNIVKYFAHSAINLLLLLEFCSRGDLFNHIVTGQYNSREARSWLLDVASGLSYLHSHYVVHCDLKSDNVLINSNNEAKLSDFGGCWMPDEEENQEKEAKVSVSATVEYMPPEFSAALNAKNMLPSIDIYAFGLLMWEVMNKTGSWMWGIGSDQITPNQLPETDLCEELFPLMILCWHIEPDKRPSATDIVRRLQPCQLLEGADIGVDEEEVVQHYSPLQHTY